MKEEQHLGTLITLEGIDGSGKSSAARALYEDLKDDYPVILTREPGATELGKVLRSLLQNRTCSMSAKSEYLIFAADRAQHFEEVVLPALEEGKIVISDRMGDSSLAYQGYGRGVDPSMIKLVNTWAMKNREPDATLYLEIDYTSAQKRLSGRNEKATVFEQEQIDFFERVTGGFEEAFKNRSGILRIDATKSPSKVRQAIKEAVISFLSEQQSDHESSSSILVDRP